MRDVLAELGVDEEAQEARLPVLNKGDMLDGGDRRPKFWKIWCRTRCVSALTGDGWIVCWWRLRRGLGPDAVWPRSLSACGWCRTGMAVFMRQCAPPEISDTGEALHVAMDDADWARFHARWPGLAAKAG